MKYMFHIDKWEYTFWLNFLNKHLLNKMLLCWVLLTACERTIESETRQKKTNIFKKISCNPSGRIQIAHSKKLNMNLTLHSLLMW